uniref:Uncharacterized protein n=1 Tax=Chromera velia CCMP2878 TaxID=1169474 RepID=A0A0G4I803_9ALVE|eukprot:Cvel_11729.t1-p1 / transcript=Cvel_11729.t1 / gene=Cvel_11729 / organism=Chromera_velia_CCMP2878 / gene_product=hypothetical protein / transcript_product=hypothetical protein / location=Cvel_scaffold744:66871-67200(+) / protein_length=110 / sequence_SO=supercontig / SO=protein_coding / is_pseudo=false
MVRRITISVRDDKVWQRLQQLLHFQGLNAHNVLWELTGVTTADKINNTPLHGVFFLTVPQQVPMVTTASNEEDDSSASDKEDNSGASDEEDDNSFMGGEEEEDSDEDEDE